MNHQWLRFHRLQNVTEKKDLDLIKWMNRQWVSTFKTNFSFFFLDKLFLNLNLIQTLWSEKKKTIVERQPISENPPNHKWPWQLRICTYILFPPEFMEESVFLPVFCWCAAFTKSKLTVDRPQLDVHGSRFIRDCAKRKYTRTRTSCVHFTRAVQTAI